MKSYTIHLIRHGITQGNLDGKYIGSTDTPLCAEGIAQLEELHKTYQYPQAEAYYTSPLLRCVQTLNILYPNVKSTPIEGLRECSFGEWEQKTAADLASDPRFTEWIANGQATSPPGGESGPVFMQRVCAAFEKLVEDMMRSGISSSVIVGHGGSIMTILAAYGLPKANFYDWIVSNGCGYSLRITPGLWMRSMVAEVYATIPENYKAKMEGDQKFIIDVAREAANRAYGEKSE